MAYYVFRINYDDWYKQVRQEIIHGRLRQGWGAVGMSLEQSFEDFRDAWRNVWNDYVTDDATIRRKYNNLKIMQNMKEGDTVIVPKLNLDDEKKYRSFTILDVEGDYYFEPMKVGDNGETDFGHVIPVRKVCSCCYDSIKNVNAKTISAKFNAYRRSINLVGEAMVDFINAVDEVYDMACSNDGWVDEGEGTVIDALEIAVSKQNEAYLKSIVDITNKWSSSDVEKVVEALFVRNGYTLLGRNLWDGEGGDKDLVFGSHIENSLVNAIYGFGDNSTIFSPEIRVQVKKKYGDDQNDVEGIQQLVKMMANENSNRSITNIVINTQNEFSEEAKRLAKANDVLLVNGMQFASLVAKFGMK